MDEYAVGMSVDLLSRHSLRNNLYLAGHEFRDLARPFDWGLLARLGSRLHVLACPNDTWLSRQQFDGMCKQLPGLQVRGRLRRRGGACACTAPWAPRNVQSTSPRIRSVRSVWPLLLAGPHYRLTAHLLAGCLADLLMRMLPCRPRGTTI